MFFIFLAFVILIVLVLLHDYVRKCRHSWKMLNKFPGDYPLPLIGNALQIGFDSDEVSTKLMEVWNKHGQSNFRMSIGNENWVFLTEPDDVGIILNHPTEITKPLERNAAMMPFFGNSVSTSEGERWRSTRKLISRSFNYKTLQKRVNDVNSHCDRLFNILDQYGDETPVDMYRYLRPFMFDILCDTLMGVEYNLLDDPDHPYLTHGSKVVDMITTNYFSYWRNIRPLFVLTPMYREMLEIIQVLKETSNKIICKRRKKLENIIKSAEKDNNSNVNLEELIDNNLSEGTCLLDDLILSRLPNGEPLPDDIINEEITLMCFTGHYTTTATMAHTLYCLAKYPEIQKQVFDEQRAIFKNDIHQKPINQDLSEMKYLEAVIKESIRYIPTITKIGRQLKNDLQLKDGRVVPAGSSIIVFFEAIFADPKTFSEPQKYKPERFFNNMHNFAFVPFSAGPRNCIGFRYAWVAMKATLSSIIRRYEIILGGPGTEPQFKYRIVTESINGVQLKLRKRVTEIRTVH